MALSDPPPVRLTEREQEVLKLLSIGLSAKETAKLLSITPRTVEQHIDNVRLKTRTRNRLHMVADLIRMGLISLVAFLPASYATEAVTQSSKLPRHAHRLEDRVSAWELADSSAVGTAHIRRAPTADGKRATS